jgi:hypothetical protein
MMQASAHNFRIEKWAVIDSKEFIRMFCRVDEPSMNFEKLGDSGQPRADGVEIIKIIRREFLHLAYLAGGYKTTIKRTYFRLPLRRANAEYFVKPNHPMCMLLLNSHCNSVTQGNCVFRIHHFPICLWRAERLREKPPAWL